MKKDFLKPLLAIFSVLILGIYGTIYACGGGDWDWDGFYETSFTPEAFVDKKYQPLFLSEQLFYGGESMRDYSKFNSDIVTDWSAYLGKSMDSSQVKFFLLDSSATDVHALYNYIKTSKKTALSEKWMKQIKVKDSKIKNFITFLFYAKQIESASVVVGNWNYESDHYQPIEDVNLLNEINTIYKNTPNGFLKNRWWFQMIKAYFYSSDKQKAIGFFKQTENSVPKDLLYYRALSYIAGIQYKAKNYAESNYNYSRVFDNCEPMRDVAVFCFHPQEQTDWEQSLALATNNDQKAALWAIHGYYGDEEEAIGKIFSLNPKSEYLEFLLTRLINHQEKKANSIAEAEFPVLTAGVVRNNISKEAVVMVDRIALSEKTTKPYLWQMASGYLQTLSGNYAKAAHYFDTAAKQLPKNELAQNQLRLLRFVNTLSSFAEVNDQNIQKIEADLKWLYEELPKKDNDVFRYQHASGWSKKYLAALYTTQQNALMSELFVRKDDFYDDKENLEAMKAFLSKPKHSEFEVIAIGIYNVSLYDIFEYEGVRAAFRNEIDDALVLIEKAGVSEHVFQGNPFNSNIKDCHDCDHQLPLKRAFIFKEFLLTIKTMQSNVTKKEDVYTNSLLLGNAFYNITHYGNGRVFHEGNIFGYGISPFDFRESSKAIATDCAMAAKYYKQALAAAKNNEQRAKCEYLLAKCERNDYYNGKYKLAASWWEMYDDKVNFLEWSGFKTLKNKYAKTKYYQEVLAECGYFKTYIDQQK